MLRSKENNMQTVAINTLFLHLRVRPLALSNRPCFGSSAVFDAGFLEG